MFQANGPSDGSLGFHRFVVFFTLYFVQGIPYGLQTRYLPILFRINGMDLAQVGMFKLLMLPWLFKPLWALVVDAFFTRKFWLNASMMTLSLLCIITSFVTPIFVMHLSVLMLLFNIVTSIQDIALDSVIINVLTPSQLAHGNIAQVVGYKFGGLFSGGVFSLLSDIVSWENIFFCLSAIYIFSFLFSLLFLIEEGDADHESNRGIESEGDGGEQFEIPRGDAINSSVGKTLECYVSSITNTEGTLWMMMFALFYKLGEIGATTMYPMFLLDNGVSPHLTGFWTAFTGQAFSVIGSILGGLMDSKELFLNISNMLLARGLSILVIFLGLVLFDSFTSLSYVFSVIAVQSVFLTGGAVTTMVYTLAMYMSQKTSRQCRASYYTIIATADVLGRLLFAPIIGGATEVFGYPFVFACFTVASFLIIVLLSYAPRSLKQD